MTGWTFDDYYLACAELLEPDEHKRYTPLTIDRAYTILRRFDPELADRAWQWMHRAGTPYAPSDNGSQLVSPLAKWFGFVGRSWPAAAAA